MSTIEVDVAVIGAGTAGLNARRTAVKAGASVVMIEDGPYGTTCARTGCMPSKLLIHPANIAHEIRHADRFGLHVDELRVDGAEVFRRIQSERDRFVSFVVKSVEGIPDEEKLRGHARFVDNTVLDVDGTRVEANTVIIATGSSVWTPPILQGLGDKVVTNAEIFELEELPDSLAVFGAGVIGLELGQAFQRLGVRVTFFDPGPGFPGMSDPVVREEVRAVFCEELDMHLESEVSEVVAEDDALRIRWTQADGQTNEETFSMALAAAGRRPNVGGLGLENTQLQLDRRGIPIHDVQTMQCGEQPIFIAGDASGERPVLHEASDEGSLAGRNAANYPQIRAQRRRIPLAITFTEPNIAVVGDSLSELNTDEICIGEVSYDNQGRARVMGRNRGVVRIYGHTRSGRLVGAEMFGPSVEHTAHMLSWAIQQGMTVEECINMPFYHPVVEEGIRTALRDLCSQLKFNELPCSGDELRDGPGV